MKRLLLIFAITLIAAFSVTASAGEFNLNGSYRLYAMKTDTGILGTDADKTSDFQQRFRLPFAWKVNDNVTAFMRTDWTEQGGATGAWGAGNALESTVGNADTIQIDYAWVKINQPVWDMTVGAQEVLLGNWSLLDIDQEGFTFNFKLNPVVITLAYGKLSEDGNKRDDGDFEDADSYAAQVKYMGQGWEIGGMFAMALDREPAFDDKKIGYGVFFNGTWGAVSLKSELDFFDGDASPTVSYEGMNLWADLSYKASDALTVGIAGYYANGNNSATKTQLSSVNSSGFSYQIFDYDFNSALMIDEFPQLTPDNFEMVADSGIQAIKGYVRFKATPEVTLFGMLAYATPEENITLDSKTYAVGSVDYAWMPNVVLSAGLAWIDKDYSDATVDDAAFQYMARLGVSF
jgi:hypothetical protein